ncbi:hypothetical protein H7J93_05420 [Mycobacterium barrassiae]|nr:MULTISPECIES: hypothetical protein [Mycobacteriaceae]MCV7299076.1 hypothetical protein [Mycobacterium barrassiae]
MTVVNDRTDDADLVGAASTRVPVGGYNQLLSATYAGVVETKYVRLQSG